MRSASKHEHKPKFKVNACLNVSLSLDGPEKIHNLIRGNNKSYKSVIETYYLLENLKGRCANLDIQLCGVFSSYNKNHLAETYKFVDERLGCWYGNTLVRSTPYSPKSGDFSYGDYRGLKLVEIWDGKAKGRR